MQTPKIIHKQISDEDLEVKEAVIVDERTSDVVGDPALEA